MVNLKVDPQCWKEGGLVVRGLIVNIYITRVILYIVKSLC